MTTTTDQPSRSTTSPVVDRFLQAIETGRGVAVAGLYSPGAVLDATVPGWRFRLEGADAIAAQYASWFADPGRFEELDRQAFEDGEFVTYLLTWEENGIPYAAHHCHRLLVDTAGRITSDRFFCGGRWDATRLAEMAETDNGG